ISDEPSGDGPEPSPDENVQQESSPDELQLGKDSESSPDVELQDVTKPLSHDAEEQRDSKPPTDGIEQRESSARQVPEDNIDTSASQRAAGIDPKPEDGEATVDSPSKEAPVAGIPSTDSQEQDKSEIPPTIPPVKPSSSAEERLEGQAVPAEASAIKLEIDEKESEKKIVVESSTASAVPENPDVSRDLQSTPAVAGEEISPEEIATDEPAIKQESASQMRDQELLKAGILPSKYVSSSPSPGLKGKRGENEGKDLDFLEGNLRKMLQTDVPFLDLLRIFDTIENAVAKEKENQGEDLITDRIHRAIYEKLERLVKAETPERLTAHLRDVLDVLSGKIAQWVRNILTDSEMIFLNENPPMVESGELRNFGEWIVEMSERANSWTVWMQNMITELMKMQPNQVTRADWQNWTRNFAEDALKWRRYYLESVHYAHHNRAMLAGREVVKTGEIKYSKWSIQEKVIETTDFLTD
ncbi:uncharacterized protein, partial [Fopius arisanus]|uniref:Uncharacterized protein n=1 Tax=Fopius arisanus TaxID=64838 RepID=A0A9R1TRD6_9HYME